MAKKEINFGQANKNPNTEIQQENSKGEIVEKLFPTTADIDKELYKELKIFLAKKGITKNDFFNSSIFQFLTNSSNENPIHFNIEKTNKPENAFKIVVYMSANTRKELKIWMQKNEFNFRDLFTAFIKYQINFN